MDTKYEEAWECGEIILPDLKSEDEYDDFTIIPVAKYEMLIRDSEKLEGLSRYLDTDRPSLKGVKVMLGLTELTEEVLGVENRVKKGGVADET